MPWIAAGATVLGGALGGGLFGGGSSGGMPKWLKGPYKDLISQAQGLPQQQYFPGQNYVGGLPSEQAAFDQRNAYNAGIFGPGGIFGGALGATAYGMGGGGSGQFGGSLFPGALSSISQSFGQGPGSVGNYGFSTGLGKFGTASGLNARDALGDALQGKPQYAQVQGAIDAANAPVLRQLNEQIIPGLNQRATFLNNGTGGIKGLNAALPDIMDRMNENALGITEGERQRALNSQMQAAQFVSQGGLQQRMGEADLSRALAQQNYQTDLANAGLQSQFRGDALGLGQLAGGALGRGDVNMQQFASMLPSIYQMGLAPSQSAADYGAYQRMLASGQLQGDMDRWNFGQQAPYNRLGFLSGLYGGAGQNAQQAPQGSNALGILGGALTGYNMASQFSDMFNRPQFNPYQTPQFSFNVDPRTQPINPQVLG